LFRSLRFRLTFWFALSLAVIQAASGFVWHWYLQTELKHQIQGRLRFIAQDVIVFWDEGPRDGLCRELNRHLRNRNWNDYVVIRSRFGDVLCYSDNLRGAMLPLTASGRQALRQGREHFETLQAQPFAGHVLIDLPFRAGDGRSFLVQIAADPEPIRRPLKQLRIMLLTLSPLALLAVALGGWFLAGRTLAPVVRVTRSMRRISAENLRERLPVPAGGDELAQLATTFNDMLARLEESFSRIRQFSGDASHELRTPLTILKGETEVALRWAKSVEEFRNALTSNLEEIQRMERIIDNLLLLSKSDSGELPLEKKALSLSDLLQAVYLQTRSLAEERGQQVELDLDVDREIIIQGDELRLRQMLLNLLANAVKYTPKGGRIDIRLLVTGEAAVISVCDTGIGIAEEHLPRIFDRFYRTDQARNREEGGAGLGLAIVKWVVEAHEGRIEVFSRPGSGSRFVVHLPLAGPNRVQRRSYVDADD